MTLQFNKSLVIGGSEWKIKPFKFYNKNDIWSIDGGDIKPTWQDIILSGNTALTLVNAKADGLNYVKAFGACEQEHQEYLKSVTLEGACEQNETPTPTNPIDIVCNNGAIKVSKNLYNEETIVTKHFIDEDGTEKNNNSFAYSALIPVIPGDTYIWRGVGNRDGILTNKRAHAYDGNGNWISQISYTTIRQSGVYSLTMTIPTNAAYVRISGISIQETYGDTNIQFEHGTTASAYRPYGEIYIEGTQEVVTDNASNTASAENLLAIENVKDTQSILDGVVTRNIGIKILDGTENWSRNAANIFTTPINESIRELTLAICTHFVGTTEKNADMPDNSVKISVTAMSSTYGTVFFKYTNAGDSTNTFKQYLADQFSSGTPVVILYQLKTPETETVTGQTLTKLPITQTAGSINNLPIITTTEYTSTPTPHNPIPIKCNNGVVKVSKNLYNEASRVNGANIYSTGVVYTAEEYAYSALIPVIVGETYTFSGVSNITPSAKRIHGYNNSGTWVEQLGAKSTSVGSYSLTVTIPSGVSQIRICGIRIDGSNADTNVQFEQGSTATDYMSYGEIYTDGTVETITITGKNLWDSSLEEGKWVGTDGNIATHRTAKLINFPAVEGETYTLSAKFEIDETANNILLLNFRDSDGNNLGRYPYTITMGSESGTVTATAPENTAYIYAAYYRSTPIYIQLEKGSTATDYAPYFEGGTATCENLFAVNDIKDEQSILNGNVTRKVGIKVLNGTENWTVTSVAQERYRYYVPISGFSGTGLMFSNAFMGGKTISELNTTDADIAEAITAYSSRCYIYTKTFTTVEDLKTYCANQYANGTPVIVIFPRTTSTTQTVTAQPLTIQEGTNTITAIGSIDDLPIEVSYKAGVEVTIAEVQNAQLDNNVEVTING